MDNVPVGILGDSPGETLVLLTRRYKAVKIPVVPGRTYVQPSRPISMPKWDYTNPDGLQEAYDLGQVDGARFMRMQTRREQRRRLAPGAS